MSWERANAEEQSWCPWARSAPGAQLPLGVLGASDLLQLWLWHLLRMIVQSYTFAKEMSPALLAAQTELWPTDPTLVHLLHPLQLLLAHLWLLEPDFPWLGVSPTAGLLSAVSHRVQMFLVTPAGLLLNTSLVTLSCNFTVPLLRLKES